MENTPEIRDKPHNQNRTEFALYKSMLAIGLKPEPQYKISDMTVDFAFPDKKLVIEVNGSHHDEEGQQIKDYKRWCVLDNLGWSRKAYKASSIFKNPDFIAEKIKEQLDNIDRVETPPTITPPIIESNNIAPKKRALMKPLIIGGVLIVIILAVFSIFTSQNNHNLTGAVTADIDKAEQLCEISCKEHDGVVGIRPHDINKNIVDCECNDGYERKNVAVDLSCSDFSTRADAQEVFEKYGGTSHDIFWLDGDKDGIACETLP